MRAKQLFEKVFNKEMTASRLEKATENQKLLIEKFAGNPLPKYSFQSIPLPKPTLSSISTSCASANPSEPFINTLHLQSKNSAQLQLPVVLTHGFGAGLGFFYKNYTAFHDIANTYSLDWLGMGLSSRPSFPKRSHRMTDEQVVGQAENFFVESLEEWRKQVGLEKFVLLGHSLGGMLSTAYAIAYPERVSKLILISPVGVPHRPLSTKRPSMGYKFVQNLWRFGFTPQLVIRNSGRVGKRLVETYTTRRFAHLSTEEIELFQKYIYDISVMKGSGEYAISRLLLPGAYAKIPLRLNLLEMPTTFLYGSHDWMGPHHAVERAYLVKKECRVGVVFGAGHHLYLDNPDGFNHILRKELGLDEPEDREDVKYIYSH